jgi:hypothetical protein
MQRRLRRALGRDKGYLDIRPNVAIDSGVAHDPCEILVVVDLAVAHREYRTVGIADRLGLCALEERQLGVSERELPVRANPAGPAFRTPVRDRVNHRGDVGDAWRPVKIPLTCNSTHRWKVSLRLAIAGASHADCRAK